MKINNVILASTLSALVGTTAFADISIMYRGQFGSLIDPGIDAFEAATGETVERIALPVDGYDDRIALDIASGTAPDVLHIDTGFVQRLSANGNLHALNGMADKWDQWQYYPEATLNATSVGGQVYALSTDTDARMLWYSKKAFEAAGIETPWMPKTWDDVFAAAEAIKEATGTQNALVIPAGTKQEEATTMQGFYMVLLGADTPEGDMNRLRNRETGQWIGKSPALKRALEFYHKAYIEDGLAEPGDQYSNDVGAFMRQGLIEGDVGIWASGSWENNCIWDCGGTNLPPQAERDEVVHWAPFPGSGVEGAPEFSNISAGWTIAVNEASENKELAEQLLMAIFDRENFEPWVLENGRMAVRSDIAATDAYKSDAFFAAVTPLNEKTTKRDAVPGYYYVSSQVQKMTADILDGVSVDDALEEYYEALVDEFGEEAVAVYE
ncbi:MULTISPECIES: extracellular solute-binding protein [Halocynthiibacter]|uniref:Extracellular solute-binding protein n=1 Tax=Halocynthiibacter halioticoli TaxID=2986804 RepID=A0AAE3LPW9_9RHOB|nr:MULTISPECIES: extracellular solute-binding protein [Halocynthiibacter]MCV6822943.1 extracellular solute-binding protein [Halocynthiibacter halioticoli]MCW4055944.1 extracellular solute-binding protein [Halocynthiibacter sp. SDUM655004]